MWKNGKAKVLHGWAMLTAWTLFWWALWWSGPPTRAYITTDTFEAAIERACRRVLQAHEARWAQNTTPCRVCFMDTNETEIIGHATIPAWQRTPQLLHGGKQYNASRFVDGVWIYRRSAL